MVQLASGCTVVQSLVCLNSPASAPPKVTLFTVNGMVPGLVTVTGVGLLPVPTTCEENVTEEGERLAPGPGAFELMSRKAVDRGLAIIKSGLPSSFMSEAVTLGNNECGG